ncbi:hypothetical protein ASPNIDRAFT_209577 [Aspergillus niger ATCC 1015]|uniref:UDP-glucose:glycoprotein glucosyltransferase n=1 Tax=Aspergillus niger (strain ATCC 1015 / CBS 113.46 / FGSC A1144 / LSHB Ac4 / NCTC 3858a / NRRL 328 / USDA 3528.7) TaxID=380704 RepID=G3XZ10_ASPNA|nr:hypothetical protein ASPNIDRAFT_209577 [Aspergillus niger ATCC 1015]
MVSGLANFASWRLASVLIAGLLAIQGRASPSVNVALQASFDSPPYLIELLESAAEENSTSYFPLLDRIADGIFDDAVTDKDLYDRFLEVVREDGHLRTPESLSSFKLSLAMRSASPRITAHYQYYNASVQYSLMAAQDAVCPVWVHSEGKQYCSSTMERAQQDVTGSDDPRELPFDRVFGDPSLPPAILYADIASPMFKEFHQSLSTMAKEGQVSYRVRYRPPQHWSPRPVFVSGYGVELALKRTDYIVIDDRDAEERGTGSIESGKSDETEDDLDDLRPLSSSEVSRLGLNTVGYVLDSDDPFDTLVKLSQDFPKYSARVAAHNVSTELLQDVRSSRLRMLPPGLNVLWINGVQIEPRQVDAFTLLDHLRRERKLIEKFRNLGLSATDAVELLSHPLLGEALARDGPQRYNYRDDIEGGGVIMWLNNLEKDARYESWPSELAGFMQRTYPGQLPAVRRDSNNIVFPVDLTSTEDADIVVKTIQVFVKNKIPVRFGLIPVTFSDGAIAQLKVAHYLQETFGLASFMDYLEASASKNKLASPDKACFQAATQDRSPRLEKVSLSLDEVLNNAVYDATVSKTTAYLNRLGMKHEPSHAFVNGIPVTRNDKWAQEMSTKISKDTQLIQQKIADAEVDEDTWLPELFLSQAFDRRNPAIVPEDPKEIRAVDLVQLADSQEKLFSQIPRLGLDESNALESAHAIVVGNFDEKSGYELLSAALESRKTHGEVEMLFLHNPKLEASPASRSVAVRRLLNGGKEVDASQILEAIASSASPADEEAGDAALFWEAQRAVVEELGLAPGERALVINGRVVGPIAEDTALTSEDLDQLLIYEKQKRITPVAKAVKALEFDEKLSDPLDFAKLTSLTTLSTISDVPEGIYESTSDIRLNLFNRWNDSQSAITVSNSDDPAITIVASIDPTSEDGSNVDAIYALEHILIEGHSRDMTTKSPPRGVQLVLGTENNPHFSDTIIMANLGYFQFKAQPGLWNINLKPGRSERIFTLDSVGSLGYNPQPGDENNEVALLSFQGRTLFPRVSRKKGYETEDVLETNPKPGSAMDYMNKGFNFASGILSSVGVGTKGSTSGKQADINIFSVASGHLYERMLNIMMVSVMRNTNHSVKFWFIEQFLSPSFKSFLPHLAKEYNFSYEMVTYKWPHWLRAQKEKQREIWGYKILFLDVLFPLDLDKVIFVDADQIVRTDMYDLVSLDLEGAPYGFTPMCDSRHEMEGFRFWKQGYWKNFLRGQPYHISALYVVDLNRFRAIAAGDRLRGQYQMLSADPESLSNLDQDLPNHMQHHIPIKSLPQEWLWCETWCSDESQSQARTIDLCNNPMTKEPKLDRARRQVPEWTEYDDEIAALSKRVAAEKQQGQVEEERAGESYPDEDEEGETSSGWDKDEL